MKRTRTLAALALVALLLAGCGRLAGRPEAGGAPPEADAVPSPSPVASVAPPAPSPPPSPAPTPPSPSPAPTGDPVAAGCERARPVPIPTTFIPYENRLGYPHKGPGPLISAKDRQLSSAAAIRSDGLKRYMPDPGPGLELTEIYERTDGSGARAFYLPLPAGISLPPTQNDLLRIGGVVVEQIPTMGYTASRLAEETRENLLPREPTFVLLHVGEHEAILNHGDEDAPGLRPVVLAWSDGTTDWRMEAGTGIVDSTVLVDMARSMYCD